MRRRRLVSPDAVYRTFHRRDRSGIFDVPSCSRIVLPESPPPDLRERICVGLGYDSGGGVPGALFCSVFVHAFPPACVDTALPCVMLRVPSAEQACCVICCGQTPTAISSGGARTTEGFRSRLGRTSLCSSSGDTILISSAGRTRYFYFIFLLAISCLLSWSCAMGVLYRTYCLVLLN